MHRLPVESEQSREVRLRAVLLEVRLELGEQRVPERCVLARPQCLAAAAAVFLQSEGLGALLADFLGGLEEDLVEAELGVDAWFEGHGEFYHVNYWLTLFLASVAWGLAVMRSAAHGRGVPFLRFNVSRWLRWLVAFALFAGGTWLAPRWWCGREGERWYDGDRETVAALARHVAGTVAHGVSEADFTSDSALFRGEWMFGTYQMAALGLLQTCREHPELREDLRPGIENAIAGLLSPAVRAFDAQSWSEDALDSLDGLHGHAAYLGYLNLVLALDRATFADSRHTALNDRLSAALARRFRAAPHQIIETYPNEAYPVDNASGIASLLLHQRLTGTDHSAAIAGTLECFRDRWWDSRTGLLLQGIDYRTGQPYDRGRASGTALAAYFLAMADLELARPYFQSLRTYLAGSILGFGYVDEYASGERGGGDIDSGPLIFGMSPSGTGFTIASARTYGDRALYVSLARTAYLMGAPVARGDDRYFVTGGPLGNAIMLAMLTAQPVRP